MRRHLQLYIRSMTEQERAGKTPSFRQDLGTFLCWLLEAQGYDLLVRAYRHEGRVRLRKSGNYQAGVEVVASRSDTNGVIETRFILKTGDVDFRTLKDADYGLNKDLHEAQRFATTPSGGHQSGTTPNFVVVINGDLDRTGHQAGTIINGWIAAYKKRGLALDWWDNATLVAMAELALKSGKNRPDRTALFPPGTRPFYALCIDGMHTGRFDLANLDLLLGETLPLKEDLAADAKPPSPLDRSRACTEQALFARILHVEWQERGSASALPMLDALHRIITRVMAVAQETKGFSKSKHWQPVQETLKLLMRGLVEVAASLRERLLPLLPLPDGLAAGGPGERVDYPLRCLRLAGHLAVAGLAALDLQQADGEDAFVDDARFFAKATVLLATHQTGWASPVTDDQVIELSACWHLWARVGMQEATPNSALKLVERLALRRVLGLPGPAAWYRARIPLEPLVLRGLVEVHHGRGRSYPGFEDGASTIVPLALRLALDAHRDAVEALLPSFLPRNAAGDPDEPRRRSIQSLSLQLWQPPEDGDREWYRRELDDLGVTAVLDLSHGLDAFIEEFDAAVGVVPNSLAQDWGLPALDWVAWMRHRTPPPVGLLMSKPFSQTQGG